MPILYNNNPIIIHTNNICLVRGNPVFCTSIVSPGETPTFRASCVSPGVTPTFRALQSRPRKTPTFCAPHANHYVWQPQGFGSLPNCRPGVGKLPTRLIQSSLRSTSLVFLYTQLGRVSPYGYEVSPPLSGLVTLTVWDLPEQAHNSYLYRLQIMRTDSSAYDQHLIL